MKTRMLALVAVAFAAALCLALAGCGGSSEAPEPSDSAEDASTSVSAQDEASPETDLEAAASEEAESEPSSQSEPETAAEPEPEPAADYTAGNGTLDCEYATIEVTGQDVWNYSDGTKGTQLLLHITNKTDHNISLDPTLEWDINGNAGYGLIMENPPAGGSVDTYAVWNAEDGSTVSEGGITSASGMITIMDMDNDYEVLGRYDFSYTA